MVFEHPAGRNGLVETILEIWYDQVYTGKFYRPSPGDVIIDGGANIGLFSIWIARKHPQCRVLAFEPFAENFKLLQRNMASAGVSNVKAFQAALGGRAGKGEIKREGQRSLDHRLVSCSSDAGEDAINIHSFSDVLRMAGGSNIALFKIDIEGSEYDLIDAADPKDLDRVDRFAIEYHDNIRPGTLQFLKQRFSKMNLLEIQPASTGGYGMLYVTRPDTV